MSTAPKAAPGTVAISDARPRRCMSAASKPWKASRSLRPSNSPTPAFGSTSLALVRSTGAGCLYAVFMARPAIQRRLNAAVIMLLKWTNDIAKYFAIIPAAFAVTYPGLGALNIMRLHSPTSAILSAVIFNAVIIVGWRSDRTLYRHQTDRFDIVAVYVGDCPWSVASLARPQGGATQCPKRSRSASVVKESYEREAARS